MALSYYSATPSLTISSPSRVDHNECDCHSAWTTVLAGPALLPGNVSGTQLRDAISARSNFGLGFALTHIQFKSDEPHRRKSTSLSISPDFPIRNRYRTNSIKLPRLRFW